MDKVDIIVPCFNESQRLATTFDIINRWDVTEFLPRFIFVDDGSTDNTYDLIQKYECKFEKIGIRSDTNTGKGGAVQTGVAKVAPTTDFFCHWDADASLDIECIITAWAACKNGDVAIANRRLLGSHERNAKKIRRILSAGFVIYSKVILPVDFADTQCGLKMYRRDKGADLFFDLVETRFLFDLEILMKAEQRGYRIVEFPVTWEHVDGGSITFASSLWNGLSGPWKIRKAYKNLEY